MNNQTLKENQLAYQQIGDQLYLHFNHSIIANQKLYEVTQLQMRDKLHKNMVAIVWKKKAGIGRGSGVLISKNLVLTCAHVFYNKMQRIEDEYFSIYPKHSGELKDPYQIEQSYLPEKFKSKPLQSNAQFDYALIKLSKMVNSDQFMVLQSDAKFQETDQLAIFGYPQTQYKTVDKQLNREYVSQWGLKKKAAVQQVLLERKMILHYISTLPGQSGSPIVLIKTNDNKKLRIIGVHGGAIQSRQTKEFKNKGYYLTKQTVDVLKEQAATMKAEPFKTEQEIAKKAKEHKISSQAEEWNNKGDYYYQNEEFQFAVKCYQQAVKLDEQYADAFVNLGLSLSKVGKRDQSIENYQRAIEINPQNQYAYNSLGIALRAAKRYKEAIIIYERLIQINPKHAVAYNNLGLIYEDNGNREQAAKFYLKAMQANPRYHTPCHNLALNYENTQQFEKAIQTYRKAILMQPNYAEGYDGLASLLCKMGRAEEAMPYFDRALKLSPNHSTANKNKGLGLIELKRYKQAIFYLEKALKINPKLKDIYFQLGLAYEVEGNTKEAVRYFQQCIKHQNNKMLALEKLKVLMKNP